MKPIRKTLVSRKPTAKPVGVAAMAPIGLAKPPAPADDGRHAPRKALGSAALLRFEGLRGQVSCLVLDISATGAKLRLQLIDARPFDPTTTLPAELKLSLPNDRMEIDCKLAWHKSHEIGVVFVSNFRPLRPATAKPRG